MNYHIAITNELRKTGWTSHRCRLRVINRWARVEILKKQYYKLGFKNATCESCLYNPYEQPAKQSSVDLGVR